VSLVGTTILSDPVGCIRAHALIHDRLCAAALTRGSVPDDLADLKVADLTEEQVYRLLETTAEGGIRLSFAGKQAARQISGRVRPRVLTSVGRYSAGDDQGRARNILIDGDNLQSMVTLYKYRGQVDLILTDPPYNTGQDFRYNDRWDSNPNDEGLGDLVAVDDVERHTKWLKFMWPRLQMMEAMLKPGGVLAICIDERELFRLGQMLDELFDPDNRLAIINWQKASAPKNDKNHVASTTEYVLVYAKSAEKSVTRRLARAEDSYNRYKNVDDDPRGRWREHDLTARTPSKKDQYGIQSPFTGTIHYPSGTRSWAHPKRNIRAWLEEWGVTYEERKIGDGRTPALMVVGGTASDASSQDEERRLRTLEGQVPAVAAAAAEQRLAEGAWPFVWFGLDGQGGPRPKKYLEAVRKGLVPTTYWARDEDEDPLEIGSTSWEWEQSGLSQSGVKELTAIVGPGHGFTTVKPLQLMMKIIQIWCPTDGLVLDPFAGSGTTGHAVLLLNAQAEADRSFVMIEQGSPDSGDRYAKTLTSVRLQRAISGAWHKGAREGIGGGFTYQRLSGRIDGDALLRMARADLRDTVIFAHYNEGKRRRSGLRPVDPTDKRFNYLVARNEDDEGFFLVWDGPEKNTDLTKDVYAAIVDEAKTAGLALGRYHVYARRWVYQRKTTSFYQIPDFILASFGLDTRSEPFSEDTVRD
jgi:adenine-specific DNA-methyltransferase